MARVSASSSAVGNGHPPESEIRQIAPVTTSTTGSDSEDSAEDIAAAPRQDPPFDPSLLPRGSRSLSLIAVQAFGLGIVLAGSAAATAFAAAAGSQIWRFFAFFACLSVFHFLEFWTTAHYNLPQVRASSFLLRSNKEYNVAHAIALLEILGWWLFFPQLQAFGGVLAVYLGVVLVVVGQTARSAAMITAGTNFNHVPVKVRMEGHELVTTGIYSWLRHPSYFGFFWWALGTQILVGNKLCLVGYSIVLWRFFYNRIIAEEESLVSFFGYDYDAYRSQTGTGILFIK